MTRKILTGLLLLALVAGSAPGKKTTPVSVDLTERQLWEFHRDTRYTIFTYQDGSVAEGLLLRWNPDSILIQPRKMSNPLKIPAAGLMSIKIEIGNRLWESLVIGTVAASAYAVIIQSWKLTGASMGSGVAKLLGPPAILVGSMAVGSGMNKYEEYTIPPGFKFDFEKADLLYKSVE